jgi:hypothetical protein
MNTSLRKPALYIAAICLILIAIAAVWLLARFYFTTTPVAPVVPSPSSTASPTPVVEQYPPAGSGSTAAWAVESHTETFDGEAPTPILTGYRTGTHSGFDRIAFDFRHDRAPGYTIGYVNQAIRDGSGEPVAMTGSNVLQIIFTPADAHTSEGERTTDAPVIPRTTGYPGLQSYAMTGDFEAHVTFALGVSSRNGYQIRQFQNGDKWTIYVDVRH